MGVVYVYVCAHHTPELAEDDRVTGLWVWYMYMSVRIILLSSPKMTESLACGCGRWPCSKGEGRG